MNYICLEVMSSKGIKPQYVTPNPLLMPTGNVYWSDLDLGSSKIEINPKLLLEEILRSKDTELNEDLELVIRYLRGCLEKVMDNPWFFTEIEDLKERLKISEERCEYLERRIRELEKNEKY